MASTVESSPAYLCTHAASSVMSCQLRRKPLAGRYVSTEQQVKEMHILFMRMDDIVKSFNCQKLRTSGLGEYVAFSSVSVVAGHAETLVVCATALVQYIAKTNYEIMIGISSGAVATALVGSSMLVHDVFGQPAIVAKTLQLCATANSVQISDSTYMLLGETDDWFLRGYIDMPWGETCAVWILLVDEDELEELPPLYVPAGADLAVPSRFWNKDETPPTYLSCRKLFGFDMRFACVELEGAYLNWKTSQCAKLDSVLLCVSLAISIMSLLNIATGAGSWAVTFLPCVTVFAYCTTTTVVSARTGNKYFEYRELFCCAYYVFASVLSSMRLELTLPYIGTSLGKLVHFNFNSLFVGLLCQVRFWVHWRIVASAQALFLLTSLYGLLESVRPVQYLPLVVHLASTCVIPLVASYVQDSLARSSFLQQFKRQ